MKNTAHTKSRDFIWLLAGLYWSLAAVSAEARPFAYVAMAANQSSENQVVVIDTATNSIVTIVKQGIGLQPYAVAVTSDATKVFVANRGSNNVSVIDASTNTVVATIDLMGAAGPVGIAIGNGFAYVTNEGNGLVSVIDTGTNTFVVNVPLGAFRGTPGGIAVSPDGALVYAAARGCQGTTSECVRAIDASTNMVVATVELPAVMALGALAITPDGAFLYGDDINAHNVLVVDTSTNSLSDTIPVTSSPEYLTITPDGTLVYQTHVCSGPPCNVVTVIDTSTHSVITEVDLVAQGLGLGVAATPDSAFVYALQNGDNKAVVIDTKANIIVGDVPLPGPRTGAAPFSIAIAPF